MLLATALALSSAAPPQDLPPERAAAVAAQRALAPSAAPLLEPLPPELDLFTARHFNVGLQRLDGGLAGVGPGYSVRLDQSGFRFVSTVSGTPDDAVALKLAAATRGGASLAVDPTPEYADEGVVAVARHGDALEERYALRAEGVEQSFLLHALPAGAGDLVLRCALDTPLAVETDGDDLLLTRDGEATLRFGGVTAIDADGRLATGSLRAHDGALELVVPAEFVEDARLPLLVDPLITAEWKVALSAVDVDVSYDATTDRWFAVWRQPLENGQIVGQRFDAAGDPLGEIIAVTGIQQHLSRPAVCNLNQGDLFVVAVQTKLFVVPDFQRRIELRAIRATDGQAAGSWNVSTALDVDRPAIGGDPVGGFDDVLLTWPDELPFLGKRVLWQRFECSGASITPLGAPETAFQNLFYVPGSEQHVRVTRSNGPAGNWLLACDADLLGSGRGLLVQPVPYVGPACSPQVIGGGDVERTRPVPAGNGTNLVVVHQVVGESGAGETLARCLTLSSCDLALGALDVPLFGPFDLGATHDVAVVPGGYLVVRNSSPDGTEVLRLDGFTCQPCGGVQQPPTPLPVGPLAGPLQAASRYEGTFAVDDDTVIVGWDVRTPSPGSSGPLGLFDPYVPPQTGEVRAALVDATFAGKAVDVGGGVVGGPPLGWNGEPTAGGAFELVVSEVPEGAFFAFLMVGTGEETVPLGGDVVAILPDKFLPVPVDPPVLTYQVPLPCEGDFVGDEVRVQFVIGPVPGAPIAEVPNVTLSNIVEVLLGG